MVTLNIYLQEIRLPISIKIDFYNLTYACRHVLVFFERNGELKSAHLTFDLDLNPPFHLFDGILVDFIFATCGANIDYPYQFSLNILKFSSAYSLFLGENDRDFLPSFIMGLQGLHRKAEIFLGAAEQPWDNMVELLKVRLRIIGVGLLNKKVLLTAVYFLVGAEDHPYSISNCPIVKAHFIAHPFVLEASCYYVG